MCDAMSSKLCTGGFCCRIGYAIARRLGLEGVKVVISSRKEENVQKALKSLKSQGIAVEGCVCHVAKADHRQRLVDLVCHGFECTGPSKYSPWAVI